MAVDEPIRTPAAERIIAGKYRLLRLLGEGGMGAVFEAEHTGLETTCAIKLLGEAFAHSETLRKRFRREARAAAAVQHDNVVRVTDTGEDEDGTPFLVMELLDGESLASVIRRARSLSPPVACAIIREVLAGLGAAHDAGVVHRDLKAANIFMSAREDGTSQVKILDFGISKFARDAATQVTAEGAVIGTPAYMAPEQITGSRDVDKRVDIYAVGVLLYRLLAGELPFRGKTAAEIYKLVAGGEYTPIRQIKPEIPQPLAEVVHRAMAHDANYRFEDARAFSQALVDAVPATGETTLPPVLSSIAGRSSYAPGSTGASTRRDAPPPAPADLAETRAAGRAAVGPARTPGPIVVSASGERRVDEAVSRGAKVDPTVSAPGRRKVPAWMFFAGVAVLLALAVGGGLAVAILRHEPVDDVDDEDPTPAAVTGEPLIFGVVEFANEEYINEQFLPVAEYLTQRTQRPVELRTVQPHELVDEIVDGGVQLAALSPYRYVTAKERNEGLRLLAMGYGRAGTTYEGLIVSRVDSGIHQLSDLEGQTFCYVDHESSSGYIYPRALLRQVGMHPDNAFRTTRFTRDHSNSLRLLSQGLCDGAAIYRQILFADGSEFDQAQFRILASTARIPNDAYVASSEVDEATVIALSDALIALEPNEPNTVGTLGDTDLRGFVGPDESLYDGVREIRHLLEVDEAEATPAPDAPE